MKGENWITFKPSESDLTKVLGDLESLTMQSLWKIKSANVKRIHQEINRTHRVAVTTVATVLDRLHTKGLVDRELKKGKGLYYEYRPTLTQTQFEKNIVRSVFKGLFEAFGDLAVAYLIDNTPISDPKQAEELRRHIEKLKN